MVFSLLVSVAPNSSNLCSTLATSIDVRRSFSSMLARSPGTAKFPSCSAKPNDSILDPEPEPNRRTRSGNRSRNQEVESNSKPFPSTIPPKPRRGRRSEAAAVEDFVRNSLERTFTAIREQNPESFENMGKNKVLKERVPEKDVPEDGEEEEEEEEEMVVEEENPNWPLDAEIGWGTRASEYFEQHPIRNVVGEDGSEIDWEGEVDDNWVQEINCLEWESFAFHPSPLVVLVFERYNRASDNWKTLKELEKAIKVYWNAKDRLPPRAVKIDINIERDLAYALRAKECPQILFLRGSLVVHREKEFRTADELVQMIAHFYYKAKKPTWMNAAAVSGH